MKQKRFTSEKAILKEIDTMENLRIAALSRAEEDEVYLKERPHGAHKDFTRKKANADRRSAQLYAAKKESLGLALAKFRTGLLPMGLTDNSVVL